MEVLPMAFDECPQLIKVRQRLVGQIFLPFSRDVPVGNNGEKTGQFIELNRDVLE